MDSRDLLGAVRNLCLVAAVRRAPKPVTLDGVRCFLKQTFAADIRRFSLSHRTPPWAPTRSSKPWSCSSYPESRARAPQGERWSEASAFVASAWHGHPSAEAFAATAIANVITDHLVNHHAIGGRTEDAHLIKAVREVLDELRAASTAR